MERFGFRGERARTQVKDLSGGERRRLTLMRLLMAEPNVLVLDEPTNDLDIETLTALEDLLDHWPGTLIVVSHDRYFIERVADNVYALDALGGIRHLPGGVDQYLAELAGTPAGPAGPATGATPVKPGNSRRTTRKEVQRLEREIERRSARERELHELMAVSATDHSRLAELSAELQRVVGERESLEYEWLDVAELLDG